MEIIARKTINVVSHFVGLLTLKSKPQDLDYSMNTFVLLFLLLAIITKMTLQITFPMLGAAKPILTMFIICYESIFLSILYFTLIKFNKKNRFVQTACNFIGINIISTLLSFFINFLPTQLALTCLTKSWMLIVNFHITKHSFNKTQLKAACIYLFISVTAFLITTSPVIIYTLLKKH